MNFVLPKMFQHACISVSILGDMSSYTTATIMFDPEHNRSQLGIRRDGSVGSLSERADTLALRVPRSRLVINNY